MKRSPLKRKTPLKRTRMKRQPQKRSDVCREYAEANPHCELQRWLQIVQTCFAAEVHHIWGRKGKQQDVLSNLIHLSKRAHDWCHENPVQGRTACCWVKLQKGELDAEEVYQCFGRYLEGFLLEDEHMAIVRDSEDWLRGCWRDLVIWCGVDIPSEWEV